MITTKDWPDKITPEIEKEILRHPAVVAWREAARGMGELRAVSFFHLIKDWEEQREIRRQAYLDLDAKSHNPPLGNVAQSERCASQSSTCLGFAIIFSLALIPLVAFYRNPIAIAADILPIPLLVYGFIYFKREAVEWKQPFPLHPYTIEVAAATQSGRKDTIRVDVQIPKSTTPQARSELEFDIMSFIQARYNKYSDTPPPISHFSPYWEQTILKKLNELRIPIFRYHLYNPTRPEANDVPPDDVRIGFSEPPDGRGPQGPANAMDQKRTIGFGGTRGGKSE